MGAVGSGRAKMEAVRIRWWRAPRRWMAASVLVLGVCAVGAAETGIVGEWGWTPLLLACIAPLALVAVRASQRDGSVDLFAPLLPGAALYALMYFVPAVYALLPGVAPAMTKTALPTALLLVLLGWVGLTAGYLSSLGKVWARGLPVFGDRWRESSVRLVVGAFLFISFSAVSLFLYMQGGPVRYLLKYQQLQQQWATRGEWWVHLLVFAMLWALPAFWLLYAQRVSGGGGKSLGMGVVGVFVYAACVSLLAGRGVFIKFLLISAIARHCLGRRLRAREMTAAVVIVLGVLVFGRLYRLWTLGQGLWHGSVGAVIWLGVISSFSYLDTLVRLVTHMPEQLSWQYGATLLPLVFKFVPRALFPEKPLGAGALITSTFFPSAYAAGMTRSASFLNESYLNFGVIGVLAGMFLLGVAARLLYRYLLLQPHNKATVIIYGVSLLGLLGVLKGEVSTSTTLYLYDLIPCLAGLVLIGPLRSRGRGLRADRA